MKSAKARESVQPFGSLETARILVIGHDPTLQDSHAQAEYAFFLEYLTRPPATKAEVSQSNFAKRLLVYMSWLAGREVPLSELYVTNLCNDFLTRQGKGVIYIPEAKAAAGVEALESLVARGKFKVVLPMAEQTFYWLCKLSFVDQPGKRVDAYLADAKPRAAWSQKGLYKKTRGTPFVDVCGQPFSHRDTPVIQILHLNGWREQLTGRWASYQPGMERAQASVQQILAEKPNRPWPS